MATPNKIDVCVGENIRRHRTKRRMASGFVAFVLRVDAAALEAMETGRKRIGAAELKIICSLLSISPAEIYSGIVS